MTYPAAQIAAQTQDSHMADAYGETEWESCAQELLNRGLDHQEVEAFLRSKHMRWANDLTGIATADGLRRYLAQNFAPSGLASEAQALVRDSL